MKTYTAADLHDFSRARAVQAMRLFLLATAEGRTAAPPRLHVPVLGRRLVFTIGGSAIEDVAGFRLYSVDAERDTHVDSQVLVLLRLSDGQILATAHGAEFGAWRTAALGAVAMDEATQHLERALHVAVLGAGLQAYHHARTWAATRPIGRFSIWTRRPEAAAAFASELQRDVGVHTTATSTADEAVRDAHAVLTATRSAEPVFSASALPRCGYVATVGPKFGGRHELPTATYEEADVVLSDAPAQCARFEAEVGPLPGGRVAKEMVALADVVARRATLPPGGRTLFVSEGLAGSEIALLAALHALA